MKQPTTTDQEWLDSLRESPAYTGIDIMREHAKMCVWCDVHHKHPTRRRFVVWLNRVEVPMAVTLQAQYNTVEKKKTVFELKTILEAKQRLAADLQFRFATEDAMGWHWDDTLKRGEWLALQKSIQGINRQIAEML